jgi:hypothetical protein
MCFSGQRCRYGVKGNDGFGGIELKETVRTGKASPKLLTFAALPCSSIAACDHGIHDIDVRDIQDIRDIRDIRPKAGPSEPLRLRPGTSPPERSFPRDPSREILLERAGSEVSHEVQDTNNPEGEEA